MSTLFAGLYLTAGMAGIIAPPSPHGYQAYYYQATRTCNPYGIAAVGWSSPPDRRWSWQLEARHMSSIGADLNHGGNFGTNSVEARLTWRPGRAP
jgi:hypothetical protein